MLLIANSISIPNISACIFIFAASIFIIRTILHTRTYCTVMYMYIVFIHSPMHVQVIMCTFTWGAPLDGFCIREEIGKHFRICWRISLLVCAFVTIISKHIHNRISFFESHTFLLLIHFNFKIILENFYFCKLIYFIQNL